MKYKQYNAHIPLVVSQQQLMIHLISLARSVGTYKDNNTIVSGHVLNANLKGDKIFQRGPNISENVFRGSKNFNKIEINYPGSKYFDIFGPGGTKNGGSTFHVTGPIWHT